MDMGKQTFKNWTGLGDYQLKSNSLIQGGMGGAPNIQISSQGRSTFIKWREYIGDVATHPTTVGQFNPVTYVVNPANLKTFPWLCTIATQYEQYKPKGIIFEFRSTATDTTTNASLGSVIFATEYDLLDTNYDNKMTMLNSAYSSEAKMTDNILHGIECDPVELNRNVFFSKQSNSTVLTTADRDYDICKTTVATQGGGLAAGQSVGSLYVHYEFEFIKEQQWGGVPANNTLISSYKNTVSTPGTMTISAMVFGRTGGYDFGVTFLSNGIQFPTDYAGGTFSIKFIFSRTSTWTIGAANVATYVNCSQKVLNSQQGIGSSGWAQMFAPYNGTVLAAPGIAYGETFITLDTPLATPAQINWPSETTWGIFPAGGSSGVECTLWISLIPRSFTVLST